MYFESDDVLLFVLEILKKSSENAQSTGHFQSFNFFLLPTRNLIKNHVNQLLWNAVKFKQHFIGTCTVCKD